MNSIISFILVLGILIFVHELGHFLLAKLFGVRVLKFSLGFGNKLIGKKWGETEYLISAFPLGGYVKMFGEQPDEKVSEEEQAVSFTHKTVWQRFGIVLAGPLFNLFFAVFLFWLMFTFAGLPDYAESGLIGKVSPDSVAEKAGLKNGDLVLSIDGQAVSTWTQISNAVKDSQGKELRIEIQRGEETLTITASPAMDKVKNIFGEEVGERYLLGISRSEELEYKKTSVLEAIKYAFIQTWNLIVLTLLGLVKIIQRVVPASELGGPIRIAELAGQQWEAGLMQLVHFTGLLSINLGVLNLLPIPVLDGGHLVFLSVEAVRGKPLGEQAILMAQKIGITLLGALMIFVFYNDIARLVRQWFAAP
ncbi:MAG: RIP metalloprotease RseP [Candidatus Electrothrix scaldis]|nr:MAG: RIP metalloprotease RseP [Candidatus Electrothrix sp. GW3-3]